MIPSSSCRPSQDDQPGSRRTRGCRRLHYLSGHDRAGAAKAPNADPHLDPPAMAGRSARRRSYRLRTLRERTPQHGHAAQPHGNCDRTRTTSDVASTRSTFSPAAAIPRPLRLLDVLRLLRETPRAESSNALKSESDPNRAPIHIREKLWEARLQRLGDAGEDVGELGLRVGVVELRAGAPTAAHCCGEMAGRSHPSQFR